MGTLCAAVRVCAVLHRQASAWTWGAAGGSRGLCRPGGHTDLSVRKWAFPIGQLWTPPGCWNKVLPAGCFRHRKWIVSQFWGLEVQDQGVLRGSSLTGCEGWISLRPLSWAYRDRLLPVFLLPPSLCACLSVSRFPPFIKSLVMLDEGPPSRAHFHLVTSVMTFSPTKVMSEVPQGRTSAYLFVCVYVWVRRTQFSP